jgi:RNA polymerase sigma factor (TIGR02999 family)
MSEASRHVEPLGNEGAKSPGDLLPEVYGELRRLAAAKLAQEAPGHTLQATALVHEVWLRLAQRRKPEFNNRQHFLAAAAAAMRRILIDNARRKRALRRGGGEKPVSLMDWQAATAEKPDQLLALDEALERLAAHDPSKADLVQLRFFGGLTLEEAAEVQEVSLPTAKRHWAYARAWLFRELRRLEGSQEVPPAPTSEE